MVSLAQPVIRLRNVQTFIDNLVCLVSMQTCLSQGSAFHMGSFMVLDQNLLKPSGVFFFRSRHDLRMNLLTALLDILGLISKDAGGEGIFLL